jgi:ABC-type uncharacterized transport system permease subunit
MHVLLWINFVLATAGYLTACGLFIALVRKHPSWQFAEHFAPLALRFGLVAHIGYAATLALWEKACPMFSLHSALGMVSLAGVLTYTILARRRRLDAVGVLISGCAVFFLVIGHGLGESSTEGISPWLMALHITSNLVGSGVLLVAGGASAIYLWQDRRLKQRQHLGQGPRLPALEVLDRITHRLLWVGVPILSLGMVTGRWVIVRMSVVTLEDHIRAWLAIAAWIALILALFLRQAFTWRGRRPAYITTVGTLGILVIVIFYVLRSLGVTE